MRERSFRRRSCAVLCLLAVFSTARAGADDGPPDATVTIQEGGDEFAIFDGTTSGQTRGGAAGRPFPGAIELGLNAETSLAFRKWSGAYFSALGAEAPAGNHAVSAVIDSSLSMELAPGLSFLARTGLESERLLDAESSANVRASIPELSLSLGLRDFLFLRAGILPLAPGTDPFFHPAFWPGRFAANIHALGGTSFVGIQASAYVGSFKVGLLLLPEIAFPVFDLFSKPTAVALGEGASGSAAETRIWGPLFGGSASVFGFCQSEPGSLRPLFGGLGFDATLPIGKSADIRAEGSCSQGVRGYELEGGLPRLAEGSTDEWALAIFVSAGATLFSLFDLRAGFSYTEQGLPASAWKAPGAETLASAPPSLDLCFSCILPRITETSGLAVFALVSPDDFSSRCFFDLHFDASPGSRFTLRGEISPSNPGSVHGSGPITGSIAILANYLYLERL